jgi:hypothetical protein
MRMDWTFLTKKEACSDPGGGGAERQYSGKTAAVGNTSGSDHWCRGDRVDDGWHEG